MFLAIKEKKEKKENINNKEYKNIYPPITNNIIPQTNIIQNKSIVPVKSIKSINTTYNDSVLTKSFNEDVNILFNEKRHTYHYNDIKLTGATTYIKKYLADFNSDMISAVCEKNWCVPKEEVKKAWQLAGDLSSSFGTGIHKALEYEDLYRNYKKPKDGSRCFVIKHPFINSIVQDFFNFYDELGFTGDIVPEALVSDIDNNICGLADRILVTSWENKTCRLQDYKVNHSFNVGGTEKFNHLIPYQLGFKGTKLNKLSLQLKFHKQMLEKSGWTVEGFDGFVFEDKWIHYEADMLDGFDIITGNFIN